MASGQIKASDSLQLQTGGMSPMLVAILEDLQDGFCLLDNHLRILYHNPRFGELLGIRVSSITGKKFTSLFISQDNNTIVETLASSSLRLGEKKNAVLQQKNRQGGKILVSFTPTERSEGFLAICQQTKDPTDHDTLNKKLIAYQSGLVSLENEEQVMELIGKTLHELIPDGIIGTIQEDQTSEFVKITNLFGVGRVYQNLVRQFEIAPTDILYSLREAPPELLTILETERLTSFSGGLYSLLMKKYPKKVIRVVETQLKIHSIMIMGLTAGGIRFGGIVIMTEEPITTLKETIEMVISQGAQVIKRLHHENVRKSSDERLRTTFEAVEDGYWDWDIQQDIVVVNDRFYTMLGYKPDEFRVSRQKLLELVHPEDKEQTNARIDAVVNGQTTILNCDYRLQTAAGKYKHILSRGRVMKQNASGTPLRMAGTHTDFTERKQREEAQQLFNDSQKKLLQVDTLEELYSLVGTSLMQLLPGGYVVFTRRNEVQRSFEVVGYYGFGKNLEDLLSRFKLSRSNIEANFDEINPKEMAYWQAGTLVKYESGLFELVTRKIPKSICRAIEKWLGISEIHVMGCQWNQRDLGGFVFLSKNGLGSNKDMIETLVNDTAMAIARIMSENEVRNVQTRYRNIFEESPIGIATVGVDAAIKTVNRAFLDLFDYSQDELINTSFLKLASAETLRNDQAKIDSLMAGELPVYTSIGKFLRKNGDEFWGNLTLSAIKDDGGKIQYLMVMLSDITKETLAESAIQENRKFLEIVLDSIPNLVFVRDIEGRYRLANNAFAQAMGSNPQDIIGKTDLEIGMPIEQCRQTLEQDLEIINSGKAWMDIDKELPLVGWGVRDVQFYKHALPDSQNKKPAILGVITDITERKAIERDIHESEKKYRTLFESMRQGVYYQDAQGRIIDANSSALDILGVTKEEFLGIRLEDFKRMVLNEDGRILTTDAQPSVMALKTGQPVLEKTIGLFDPQKGRETWLVINAIPQYREGEGAPFQVFVTLYDITLLKQIEKELRISELKYRTLLNNIPAGVYQTDGQGNMLYVNGQLCAMTGLSDNEMAGTAWLTSILDEDRRRISQLWEQFIQRGGTWTAEYRLKNRKSGDILWVYDEAVELLDEENRRVGFIGSKINLSDQKNTEEKLYQSEQKYRLLTETMKDVIWTFDTETMKLTYLSPSIEKLRGFSVEEVLAQNIGEKFIHLDAQTVHKEIRNQVAEFLQDPQGVEKYRTYEMRQKTKSGKLIWTEIVINYFINSLTGHVEMKGVSRDISERKQAELERQVLYEIMQGVSTTKDLQDFLRLVHEQLQRIIDAKNISIVYFNKSTELFEEIYTIDEYDKPMPPSKLEKSITAYVFRTGNPLLLTSDDFYDYARRGLMTMIGTNSAVWLGAPLRDGDEITGVISVQNYRDKQCYSEHDRDFLASVASQVASAISRKQAEDALLQSEGKFRQIVELSNDIFFRENFDTMQIEYVSPNVYDLLGFRQGEIEYQDAATINSFIHPDDLPKFDGLRKNLVQVWREGRKNYVVEFRLLTKTGEFKWFNGTYSLVMNKNDQPEMILCTLSDVHVRKQNELSLRFRVKMMQLSQKLALDELMSALLDEIVMLTDSMLGYYYSVEQDEQSVTLKAWSDISTSLSDSPPPGFTGNTAWQECLQVRRPLVLNPPDPAPKQKKGRVPRLIRKMVIPVIRNEKVVSILGVANKSSNYTLSDLEMISKLADMAWDIVENKKTESALRESEAIFNAFMENSPIYVFFKDKDMRPIQLSRNYEQMLGKPLDQLLHKTTDELFPSKLASSMVKDDQRILAEGKTLVVDEEMDGRFYTTIKFPIIKEGIPSYLAGFTIDITDRVLSQKKLAESEEMYRLISSVVSDYLFSTRIDITNQLNLQWVAGAFETMTGFTMAEYKQVGGWRALLHPDDIPQDDRDLAALRQNKKVITEVRTFKKDGSIVWVKVYSQPIWDEETNQLVGIDGAAQDITERKNAEEAIRKSALEFEALYDTSRDFSIHRDPYVILRTITDRACALFKVPNAFVYMFDPEKKELELKYNVLTNISLGLHVRMGEGIAGKVAESLKPMIVNDYRNWEGRQSEHELDKLTATMCVPMMYGGQLIGVLGVHEIFPGDLKFTEENVHFLTLFASQAAAAIFSADLIEQLRRNANELEKRVDERTRELMIKNKELETFTYTVSHDLKAPLRGISGYASLLLDDYADQIDEEGRRYIANLLSSTDRMSLLIEDLLSYSRVERREINKSEVNLHALVDGIIQQYQVEKTDSRIRFVKELECGTLFTDQEALTQAIRNLVDNAVKFSRDEEEPTITIHCDRLEDHHLISVQDNGIGFDMKYYDKIFEIFQRLHLAEDYPGTGIGLAVVRKAVERLGGKIWAVSEPGAGSTFFMELPL